jgi:hypothetical protein
MDDLLDYLVREIDAAYRGGRPVWDKIDNHKEKRRWFMDALNRAKALYDLARMDHQK